MTVYVLLLLEFLLIFISSRYIFQSIFALFYGVSKNQKVSFFLVSLIFFPGVLLHEFSHLIAAKILHVQVYGIEFVPEYHNGRLKMGSVNIQKTDKFRSLLIGFAPFIAGVCILSVSLLVIYSILPIFRVLSVYTVWAIAAIAVYFLFTITNTMFSSKKDLEGIWVLICVLLVLLVIMYTIGLSPAKIGSFVSENSFIYEKVRKLVEWMSVPLAINIIVVCVSFLFTPQFYKNSKGIQE